MGFAGRTSRLFSFDRITPLGYNCDPSLKTRAEKPPCPCFQEIKQARYLKTS
jgi:hypothetical protein